MQLLNNRVISFTGKAVNLNNSGADITVDKNVFDGASNSAAVSGIFHLDTDSFNGFHFTNNWTINTQSTEGFFVDGNRNVGTSAARSSLISGNLFDNNNVGGNIGTRALDNATVSNNVFSNNNFDGLQGGPRNTLLTMNSFIDNGRSGLALTSFGNMGADRGAQNSIVRESFFSGNTREDVFFSSTQAAGTISTNLLTGNSLQSATPVTYNGTETINASGNWWGTNNNPEFAGKIAGTGAANIDYSPWLESGTDTNLATAGFQGNFVSLNVDDDSPHSAFMSAAATRLAEAISMLTSGGLLTIWTGTYAENLDTSSKAVIIALKGGSPGKATINGNLKLDANDTVRIVVNNANPATGFDNFVVNGSVTLGSAALDLTVNLNPFTGSFRIIDKTGAGAVSGTFASKPDDKSFLVGGKRVAVNYNGGTGNDVVLTSLKIGFVQGPTNTLPLFTMTPPVVVQLFTSSGQVLKQAGIAVTLRLTSGVALLGTTTVLTDANGQATFRNLRILRPGTYVMEASASQFPTIHSNSFRVAVTQDLLRRFLQLP